MINFNVDFDKLCENIEEKIENDENKIKKIVEETTDKIEKDAVKYIVKNKNIVTGKLKDSIRGKTESNGDVYSGIVKAGVDHAVFIEEGTKAHVIKAKNCAFLRFMGRDGNLVYTPQVHHPGTKANPFMSTALEDNKPIFIKKLEEVIK